MALLTGLRAGARGLEVGRGLGAAGVDPNAGARATGLDRAACHAARLRARPTSRPRIVGGDRQLPFEAAQVHPDVAHLPIIARKR